MSVFKTAMFNRGDLTELGLPYEEDDDRVKIISDEITGTTRWSIHHHLTFELDGVTYQVAYSEGATEMQDERPWEFDNLIECTLVEPVERVVTEWRGIPK